MALRFVSPERRWRDAFMVLLAAWFGWRSFAMRGPGQDATTSCQPKAAGWRGACGSSGWISAALRSDPLPAEPALTMALLVSDYEDLRRQLGLTDWAVLGHSFGGGIALAYASRQPRSVSRAIFDCPCWTVACLTGASWRLPPAGSLRSAGTQQPGDAISWRPSLAASGRRTAHTGPRLRWMSTTWSFLPPRRVGR